MTQDSTLSISTHEDLVSALHDLFGGETSIARDELSRHVRECRTERYEDHTPEALEELYDRIMDAIGAVPAPVPYADQVEAACLIEDSVARDEIITAPWTEALAAELLVECEDSVDASETVTEYWGTTDDGETWRVHLDRGATA